MGAREIVYELDFLVLSEENPSLVISGASQEMVIDLLVTQVASSQEIPRDGKGTLYGERENLHVDGEEDPFF